MEGLPTFFESNLFNNKIIIEAKEAKKREQEDLSKAIDDKFQSDLK